MRLTSASNRAVYERARKAVAQLRSNQFALIRPLCQLLIRPCQHLSRRPPRLRCQYRFLGAKGDCGVRAGCARAGCAFGRSCPAAAHGSICPAARLGRGREIKRSLLDLSSQPPDCRLTCIALLEDQPRKVGLSASRLLTSQYHLTRWHTGPWGEQPKLPERRVL
jgi:hypothetical protein